MNGSKKVPKHLKHKPIVVLEDYNQVDGIHANKTDAKGLSIGLAQWSDVHGKELSAKVWRHTGDGGQWSRQSEELPLHRVLDLASLLCASIYYVDNNKLPSDEAKDFKVELVEDSELLEQLKKGLKDEKTRNALEVSLKRLSEQLKCLGR